MPEGLCPTLFPASPNSPAKLPYHCTSDSSHGRYRSHLLDTTCREYKSTHCKDRIRTCQDKNTSKMFRPPTLKNYIDDTILWIYDIIGVVWIFVEYAWLPKTAGLLKGLAQRSIHLGIWFVRPAAVVAWLAAVVACVGGARATVSTASNTFQYPL